MLRLLDAPKKKKRFSATNSKIQPFHLDLHLLSLFRTKIYKIYRFKSSFALQLSIRSKLSEVYVKRNSLNPAIG